MNSKPQRIAGAPAAFTLTELLVVVATLALLVATILPALAHSRSGALALQCLNNHRQLVRGWSLYAADFGGTLCRTTDLPIVSTVSPTKNYPDNQWCMGWVDRAPGWTNSVLIQDSLLYPYVRSLSAYKCPADLNSVTGSKQFFYGGGVIPIVRSMSMNGWLNPFNPWAPDRTTGARLITNFRTVSQINKPSATWVTMDENPRSINGGWFICDPTATFWIDAPGWAHEGGCGMSFADGHVELKRWHDPSLLGFATSVGGVPKDGRVDLQWLQDRSTY